jgi:hypothetical protein
MRAREQKYFRPAPEPEIATEQNRFGFTGLPCMCDVLCAAGSLQSLPTELSRIISLNALLKPFCSGSDVVLVKMVPQRYALAVILKLDAKIGRIRGSSNSSFTILLRCPHKVCLCNRVPTSELAKNSFELSFVTGHDFSHAARGAE